MVYKIITPQQHGLLKGNSTSAFFLDLSKAFDYRDHKLLEKDEEHGS